MQAQYSPVKAYARARGCSPAAVRKAIERLGIPRDSEGRIDTSAAERLWPREGKPGGRTRGEPRGGTEGEPDATTEDISFSEARRRKELALAQLREHEVAERGGRLIPLQLHEQRLQVICQRLAAQVKGLGKYLGDVQRAMSDIEAAMLLERISDDLLRSLMGVADEIDDDLVTDDANGDPGDDHLSVEVVTYAEARRRRELAKAQREELALCVAQGRFGSIEYLDRQLADCLQGVRMVLLNMPGKIAPQLVGVATVARAQIILQEAIDEALPTLQAVGCDPSLDLD